MKLDIDRKYSQALATKIGQCLEGETANIEALLALLSISSYVADKMNLTTNELEQILKNVTETYRARIGK